MSFDRSNLYLSNEVLLGPIRPTITSGWVETNFFESQKFVNEVGNIAEAQGHHPDIIFGWGYAKVQIFTHKIKGLVESDFILAAKINKI